MIRYMYAEKIHSWSYALYVIIRIIKQIIFNIEKTNG